MEEIWKNSKTYEGLQISNWGNVRTVDGKLKPQYVQNKGYSCVSYFVHGKTVHFLVHREVAKTFLPNPGNYKQVNHIDCDKRNNAVDNLEWCNQRYNYNEGMKHFLYSHNEQHYFSKLKNEDIPMMAKLFSLGFTRTTIARIFNINASSIRAIEKGISYRELGIDFSLVPRTKYKDMPNIKLPSDVRDYFKDNTVLNTLIAQGKVSV